MSDLVPTLTIFGRAEAPRCQARAKHSGEQCRKAAVTGKRVCRTHGGRSTGPKTAAGRQACSDAKTVHGRETREIRRKRAEGLRELRKLEKLMADIGMIEKAPQGR